MGRSADVDALDLSPEAGPPLQQLSVEVGAAPRRGGDVKPG